MISEFLSLPCDESIAGPGVGRQLVEGVAACPLPEAGPFVTRTRGGGLGNCSIRVGSVKPPPIRCCTTGSSTISRKAKFGTNTRSHDLPGQVSSSWHNKLPRCCVQSKKDFR